MSGVNGPGGNASFYIECAAKVDPLAWPDILRIGGPDITAAARLVRLAYEELVDQRVPKALTAGPFRVIGVDECGAQVEGYHGSDPLHLSRDLLAVLPQFDGRTTPATIRAIAAEHHVRLAPDLVRKLADFEILVPPKPPS